MQGTNTLCARLEQEVRRFTLCLESCSIGFGTFSETNFQSQLESNEPDALSSILTDLCTGMHKSLVGTSSRWPCCARSLHIPHLKSHHLNQLPTKDSGKAIKPCWRLPSGRAAFTDKCSSNRTPCAVQAVRALHKPSNRGQVGMDTVSHCQA